MTRHKTTANRKPKATANRHRNAGRKPTVNRRHNRRRNPHVQSLVMGAAWAAVGAMVTSVIAGFIPISGGGLMGIVKQGLAAYATGYIGERFTSPGNAQLMAIGGFASAAGQGIKMIIGEGSSIFSNLLPAGPAPAQLPDGGTADLIGWDGFGEYSGFGDLVPLPPDIERYAYAS